MVKPIRIFIDGKELINYTSCTLTRKKDDMTGQLTVEIFVGYYPTRPIVVNASVSRMVTVYVAGALAFVGKIDTRNNSPVKQNRDSKGRFTTGKSTDNNEGTMTPSFSPDGYRITLSARGMTKYLLDSSHEHPTSTILKTTNKKAIEALIAPWGYELDWQATEIDMPIVRFADGGRVVNELHAISNETCIFLYETRDGKIRAIDQQGTGTGDDLILGQNILDYSATQSEDQANSQITVKGQRSDPSIHGRDAVMRTKVIQDNWVTSRIPLKIQMYGDATDENLERRGKFEADQRAREAKSIAVEMFGFLQSNGEPWDIGGLHYTEIPAEGVFDVLEVSELNFSVDAKGTYKANLTLTPPASSGVAGSKLSGSGGFLANGIPGLLDAAAKGAARRALIGVTTEPGDYPLSWGAADLLVQPIVETVAQAVNMLLVDKVDDIPLKLPSEQ